MAAPASAAAFAMLVCGMVAGSAVTTVDPDGGQLPVLQSPCRFAVCNLFVVETVTRDIVHYYDLARNQLSFRKDVQDAKFGLFW